MSGKTLDKPYEAVILAAGRGSRLSTETGECPKALLPIGPRGLDDATVTTFLRRQVELYFAAGIERVVVVVGYLREQIEAAVASWPRKPELVVNDTPDIGISGSLHSFQFAVRAGLGLLDGTHQTILADADIVYHRDVLKALLEADERSTILISPEVANDEEEVLVWGSIDAPRFLGKGLTEALTGGLPLLGEATGIVKFAPADHALARQVMDWMLGDPAAAAGTLRHKGFGPAKRATEHEELTQRLMLLGKMCAVRFGSGLPFMEVDSPEEYAHCRGVFYPRLLELEGGSTQTETAP